MKKKRSKSTAKPVPIQARNTSRSDVVTAIRPPTRKGPEPERLKLQGDWTANVDKALAKKRPPGGWPIK